MGVLGISFFLPEHATEMKLPEEQNMSTGTSTPRGRLDSLKRSRGQGSQNMFSKAIQSGSNDPNGLKVGSTSRLCSTPSLLAWTKSATPNLTNVLSNAAVKD
eukprot:5383975-Amphidinium_carterae.1